MRPRTTWFLLVAAFGAAALASLLHLSSPVPAIVVWLDLVVVALLATAVALVLVPAVLRGWSRDERPLVVGAAIAVAGAALAAAGPAWNLASAWRIPLLAAALGLGLVAAIWPRRALRPFAVAGAGLLFAAEAGLAHLGAGVNVAAIVGLLGAATIAVVAFRGADARADAAG